MKPRRIQRKRTPGWRMPENTVYVGRGKGAVFHNPFVVGKAIPCQFGMGDRVVSDPGDAVNLFRDVLASNRSYQCEVRFFLRGKNLACWCPLDQPCHADVLLEIANS